VEKQHGIASIDVVAAQPSRKHQESIMKLYGFPLSPNTWKVRAVAAHLGLPLELEFVDLLKGEARTPAFLAINPTGRTPTLVDGAFKLWESNAIMQYLASKVPNALWPDDAQARADIMRWQSWQLAHWGKEACDPLTFELLVKKFASGEAPDQAVVAKATTAFNRDAAILDAHLGQQPYLVGDKPTLADFSVASVLFYAKEAEMPMARYPHVLDWFGRMAAMPCWSETAPQMQAAA
jgi:glutathione S-transferase